MNKHVFLLLAWNRHRRRPAARWPRNTPGPTAPVPADWPTGAAYAGSPSGDQRVRRLPDLRWREFFTDEKLQQVIGTALTNNRDLRIAALNVEQARAMYGIQRAELLPAVNATGSASKQRIPADVEGFPEPMTIEQLRCQSRRRLLGNRLLRPHPQPER